MCACVAGKLGMPDSEGGKTKVALEADTYALPLSTPQNLTLDQPCTRATNMGLVDHYSHPPADKEDKDSVVWMSPRLTLRQSKVTEYIEDSCPESEESCK